jgi:aquaporin Z
MMKSLFAELFGTFWLVLGGCGAAIFAGQHVGFLGVSFAFGLTVLTMVYAVGPISGGHFNPAVTIGLAAAGRFDCKKVVPYIVIQVVGAGLAALTLYVILTSSYGTEAVKGFAANGYGALSPGKYSLISAFIAEAVLTCFFLLVILGSTDARAPAGFAGIAIGLCLTLIHIISIPITNTSVNPARSLSQALFAQGPYLSQVWLFWVAPIVGAIVAGLVYKGLFEDKA